MPRPRAAFFGTRSHFSESALREVSAAADVVAVALATGPAGAAEALRRLLRRDDSGIDRLARELRAPVLRAARDAMADVGERLRSLRPDVLCVAIFPLRLPREVVEAAPLGAINAHPSLLPRHRGPLPIFWTYHADDRATGVTVHHADERMDAGDIILQEEFALARGYPAASLDRDLARRAGPMLREAIERLASRRAPRRRQDEEAATQAPLVERGRAMVDFETWPAERVWHFLAALCPRFREPLCDEAGGPVDYAEVAGFENGASAGIPGRAQRAPGGWRLACRDGWVRLLDRNARSAIIRP